MGITNNKIKIMKKFVYASLAFAPVFAFAAALQSLVDIADSIGTIVKKVIPILFGLAIIYFFWGLVVFLRSAGDPKAQEAGRNQMIWGVITIAVMVSVYGLVQWLQTLFNVNNSATVNIPTVSI